MYCFCVGVKLGFSLKDEHRWRMLEECWVTFLCLTEQKYQRS
jgi:hypothetical protein